MRSNKSANKEQLLVRFRCDAIQKLQGVSEPLREDFEDEVLSFFLHSADLSGASKKFELSLVWAKNINLEFTAQYKEETRLNIPQTPHFKDLNVDQVFHKNECGFRKFIILPLYQTFLDLERGFCHKSCGKRKTLKPINQESKFLFFIFFNIRGSIGQREKKFENI